MPTHILCTLVLLATIARAELISTGVGVVRGRVVTSREVQMQNLLEAVLYSKTPVKELRLLALDSKAFSKATQDSLLETVVAMEAQSFNVIQLGPGEVKDAEKKALKTLKNTGAWKTLEVAPHELEDGLKRKLQAKKFVQFRAQSSVLPVTDSEAQRYYNENPLKFDGLPFENLKENIKTLLGRAQVDRRLKDWYDVLLNKYQVKNLIAEI